MSGRLCKYPEQGAQMRKAREGKGLTRKALAERSGVSLNTIEYLENGITAGTITTARLLANALGITIDEYVGNNREKKGK